MPRTSPSAQAWLPAVLAAAAVPTTLCAQQSDVVVEAKRIYAAQEKFDRPIWVGFHDTQKDAAFVVEQPGTVWLVACDDESKERKPFLDLTQRVYANDNWEEGLLGFAFDPAYAENGFVYCCFTEKTEAQQGEIKPGKKAKSTRRSIVARYATKAGESGGRVADAASELVLLTVFQPFPNHNGGTIVFGPDRMLYLALGDGGLARDPYKVGQDKGSLLGKVLRIDVRNATAEKPYEIPKDNPFVAEEGARGEIWCYGLRNPWRIAFDRATGELWCGDVGQDRVEEVDLLTKGGNYGWSVMEGTEHFDKKKEPTADMIAPVAEYPHSDGVSVTGGHVYRGKAMPALDGCYVYGDFSTFRIWAVKPGVDGAKASVREIGRAPAQIASFAEEPDGELLMTCFDGRVYRLVPKAGG